MEVFFLLAYALVIFCTFALVGALPALVLGLIAPDRQRPLLLPGAALALVGWIWAGWFGALYGISRFGLVVFAGVGALAFVQGWSSGLRAAGRARGRCSRRSSSRL